MSEQNVSVPTDIQEYREFVAKGGLKTATGEGAKKSSAAGASQAESESDSEPGEGQQKEPHQKKSGFQRRVDKLNQKLGAKDAEIAELRRQIEARESGATKPAGDDKPERKPEKEKQQQVEAKPKPQQKDFETYDEFVEALTDWKTEDALRKRENERREARQKQTADEATQAVLESHNKRVDQAKKDIPDYAEAFKGLNDDSFSESMMVAIFESEVGPVMAHHLATHRSELERIAKLSPTRQAVEMGKLEAKFAKAEAEDGDEAEAETSSSKTSEAKPKPRVSQAPPPAKPLKGKSSGDDPMPDPSDFAAYEAWSRRQAAAGKKR